MTSEKRKILFKAEDAFWAVIAASHPEITTGDFDPSADNEFTGAQETAYCRWVQQNTPASRPENFTIHPPSPCHDSAEWVDEEGE